MDTESDRSLERIRYVCQHLFLDMNTYIILEKPFDDQNFIFLYRDTIYH